MTRNIRGGLGLFLVAGLAVLLATSVVACSGLSCSPVPENKPSPVPQLPQIKPPIIVAFEVSPTRVTMVELITLRWEVTGAATVTIDQGVGEVPSAGTKKITPVRSTVYKLTATNAGGSVDRTVSIMVYENEKASQIALTEEDVKSAHFIYSQNSEPKINDTISTYYIKFVRRGYSLGGDEILDNTISIHTTVAATEKRYIEIKSNARETIANIVTIGDEGYAIKFSGGDKSEPATYVIRFRKNNVYVNLGTIPNYKELESFARIVESRIK